MTTAKNNQYENDTSRDEPDTLKNKVASQRKMMTLSKRGENVFSRDTFEPKNMSPNNYYNSPHPELEISAQN